LCFYHKKRKKLIHTEFEAHIWNYIGAIPRKNNMKSLRVGGTANHIHALFSLNPTTSVSKTIQLIKGASSKWINDNFYSNSRKFKWQGGNGTFSVSESMVL